MLPSCRPGKLTDELKNERREQVALERVTILDRGPVHYCHECASTEPIIIKEIEEAYQREQLDIMHDAQVSSEICASCQRRIAEVKAPRGVYTIEMQITFQCRVEMTAWSPMQAHYSLRHVLDTQDFEYIQDEIAAVLREHVREAHDAEAYDCSYEVEPAREEEEG